MKLAEKLSTLAGEPRDFIERNQIGSLRYDVEFLSNEIKAKRQVLDFLDEHEKSLRVEYEAEIRYDASKKETLYADIETMKGRSEILLNYVRVMSTEEFKINKMARENTEYFQTFWLKLKEFTEKSKQLSSDLEQLKEMYNKCLQLKHQANGLMAPSH